MGLMTAFDLKVFKDPILRAFGIEQTVVVRPAPDDAPVTTTAVWLPPDTVDTAGLDVRRREPRRVVAFPVADVPTLPRGSYVYGPDIVGGTSQRWRVDGFDRYEFDLIRVLVVSDPEET
jgi:hypothetical protein